VWVPAPWTNCCACRRGILSSLRAEPCRKSLSLNCWCPGGLRATSIIRSIAAEHHAGPPFHPLFWFLALLHVWLFIPFFCLTVGEHLELTFLVSMHLLPYQSR
jgi:hypothetical protein